MWLWARTCNYKPLGTDRAVDVRMFLSEHEAIKGSIQSPYCLLMSHTELIWKVQRGSFVSNNTNNDVLVGRAHATSFFSEGGASREEVRGWMDWFVGWVLAARWLWLRSWSDCVLQFQVNKIQATVYFFKHRPQSSRELWKSFMEVQLHFFFLQILSLARCHSNELSLITLAQTLIQDSASLLLLRMWT